MIEVRDLQKNCRSLWFGIRLPADALITQAKITWPRVFGLPVAGPMAQLYRIDAAINTVVSLPNSLSYFFLQENFVIRYRLSVCDRKGRRIAFGSCDVGPQETVQRPLRDLVTGDIDEFGIFAVEAKYDRTLAGRLGFLRQTVPQFMTMFLGCGDRAAMQAPQILHSHKRLRMLPVPLKPVTTKSQSLEYLSNLERLSIFVLNTSPTRSRMSLAVSRAYDGHLVWQQNFSVDGWAVHRLDLHPQDVAAVDHQPYALRFDFDRPTGHRRPILFRHFASGLFTSNHA